MKLEQRSMWCNMVIGRKEGNFYGIEISLKNLPGLQHDDN